MWNEAQIEEESDSKTNRPGSITHGPAKHGIILLCAYRYRFYTDNKILNAHYEILQTMSTFITNIFILASEFLSLFEPPRMFYSCAFFFLRQMKREILVFSPVAHALVRGFKCELAKVNAAHFSRALASVCHCDALVGVLSTRNNHLENWLTSVVIVALVCCLARN